MSLEKDDTIDADGKKMADSGTEPEKKFTQDDINRIVAKESKKWEKEQAEVFKKASEFDKLQDEIKKQKEAEQTELERLNSEVTSLTSYKTRVESYEAYLKSQFEELASELSEEDRETIENLSVPITEKLSLAKRFATKTQTQIGGAARASNGIAATPDKLTALAEEKMKTHYPREVKGTDSYKVKMERIRSSLQQT